jgi:hypothetical protein
VTAQPRPARVWPRAARARVRIQVDPVVVRGDEQQRWQERTLDEAELPQPAQSLQGGPPAAVHELGELLGRRRLAAAEKTQASAVDDRQEPDVERAERRAVAAELEGGGHGREFPAMAARAKRGIRARDGRDTT